MISPQKLIWMQLKFKEPPKEGSYLVTTDRGAVCMAHWYKSGFSGPLKSHITHWMDKPKAASRNSDREEIFVV